MKYSSILRKLTKAGSYEFRWHAYTRDNNFLDMLMHPLQKQKGLS